MLSVCLSHLDSALPVCHEIRFGGEPPYVVGRVAVQSASRDREIVRCRVDYEAANGQAECIGCIGKFSLCLFVSSRHPTRGRRKKKEEEFALYSLSYLTRTRLYLACLSLVFQRYRPSNDIPVLAQFRPLNRAQISFQLFAQKRFSFSPLYKIPN